MLRFTISILLIVLLGGLISCKKKKEEPPPNDPVVVTPPSPYDFTLTSFPNQTGNQWINVNIVSTSICGVSCGTCCNSYTNSYTSTVTVVADTLIQGTIPGKIWLNQSSVFSDYKQVAYLEPSTQLFYIMSIDTTKGLRPACFKLPLIKNDFWKNIGLNPQDTCFSNNIEQYYNGNDYYNVVNVKRLTDWFREDYFKLNSKGLVYRKNIFIYTQGVQVFFIETQIILAIANF